MQKDQLGNLKQYKYLWEVKQLANLQNLKTSEQLSLWSVYYLSFYSVYINMASDKHNKTIFHG